MFHILACLAGLVNCQLVIPLDYPPDLAAPPRVLTSLTLTVGAWLVLTLHILEQAALLVNTDVAWCRSMRVAVLTVRRLGHSKGERKGRYVTVCNSMSTPLYVCAHVPT